MLGGPARNWLGRCRLGFELHLVVFEVACPGSSLAGRCHVVIGALAECLFPPELDVQGICMPRRVLRLNLHAICSRSW